MRKLEDKQIHQKGRRDASACASEMKEETLLYNGQHKIISRSRTPKFRRKQGGDAHGEALMDTLEMKLTTP